jgi:hypothetical protein
VATSTAKLSVFVAELPRASAVVVLSSRAMLLPLAA